MLKHEQEKWHRLARLRPAGKHSNTRVDLNANPTAHPCRLIDWNKPLAIRGMTHFPTRFIEADRVLAMQIRLNCPTRAPAP